MSDNTHTETDKKEMEPSILIADASVAIADKEKERRQIQADIEAFLAGGGKISLVDSNVVADPPKKPESSYGSQPI